MFQEGLKGVLRGIKGCIKGDHRVYQEGLKGT